jgi:hypothetical protein
MQRKFLACSDLDSPDAWPNQWLAEFRPTSQRLQNLVDVLLLMFIRDEDGHAMAGNTPFNVNVDIVEALPSFTDKLTLWLSVPLEGVKEEASPGKMSPSRLPNSESTFRLRRCGA